MRADLRLAVRRFFKLRDQRSLDALTTVAILRGDATADELERALVEELAAADDDLREWWLATCDLEAG